LSRNLCPGLSAESNSRGVSFPFNAYRQPESTSFRLTGRLPDDAPKTAASCSLTVPIPPATVPLSGFLNLSATLLLLLPSYPFQIGGVPGVASFRGLFLSRSPSGSSPLAYPLDVAPNRLRCLSPRLRLRQARRPLPRRKLVATSFVVFRVFVLVKIDPLAEPRLVSQRPACPSWTFTSSWSKPSRTNGAFAP
jgi:hypothetical protein